MQYLILAALVIAGLIVGVDAIRERAARRKALHVPGLVSAAIRTQDQPGTPVEPALSAAVAASPPFADAAGGLWRELTVMLDPETFTPRLAEGTEIKNFKMRWGNDFAIVARPDHTLHFELQPWEATLMAQMDGTKTAQELIVDHLQAVGDLDPGAVLGLIVALREGGFLDPARPDVSALVQLHLDRASAGRRKLRDFAKNLRISWSGAERFVEGAYRGGLKLFFRPVAVVLCSIVALVGLVAFIEVERSGRYQLSTTAAPGETLLFLGLALFLTFAHELGHAMALIHYKRRVLGAGFFIFFGSPAFFVDASDGLMMDRRERIVQSFAGPFSEMILAGMASLLIVATSGSGMAAFLYRFALINYFMIFMNLIPLLELDGYWIFSDLIQVPNLRRRSINFIQGDLWHKIATWEKFSLQELGLGFYGIVGIAFTIFSFYTAYFFWQEIFGGLITSLWEGGFGSRILLLLLAFAFIGPLIRGLLTLGRSVYKRLKSIRDQIRFRFQRSWRIEAASLIDALPAFDDLDENVLSDLAGRIELVTVRDGQVAFRRGDIADAFYVVRSGTIHIEDEDLEEGDTRTITTLGRGDAFGEFGLMGSGVRAATARAEGEATLFRVDKASFDRLLADDIEAPDFAPTMQAYAELRSLPPFRTLSTTDLALVLSHGEWRNVAPGERLIRQGEAGDTFFAIGAGQADVERDHELVASLGPGQHFGEIALLTDEPRNASVTAHTPLRVFVLDREGFTRVIARTFRRGAAERTPDRNMEH